VEPSSEDGKKVRRRSSLKWEVGTLFQEEDGIYRVSEVLPTTSLLFGPCWDIHLRRASEDDVLAAEVMLT